MSQVTQVITPSTSSPATQPPPQAPHRKRRFSVGRTAIAAAVSFAVVLCVFFAIRAYRAAASANTPVVPTARVQRGDLTLTITARGDLRGRNPESMIAPMTGGAEMHIVLLRKTGDLVKSGDIVVQFDPTEQEYKLKEAEADLAEAQQHILQAKAQEQAQQEEDRYALSKAKSDLRLAELEARKNPLVPALVAKQNDLSVSSARDHLAQLEQNLGNRQATNQAAIAVQEAGRAKAEAQAATARQNIEAMTLRAHHAGYVAVKQNSSGNFFFFGMPLPPYQLGDAVRPGMAVAEIPDLQNWEVEANIAELDRGHLAKGDKVAVTVIAVPNREYSGHIREIGGTMGSPWDRHFSCNIALDNPSPQLRPGMSAQLVITTDRMHDVLWLPAQAVFESDGRTFVYARSGASFTTKDVKLVRRNETRVVISGLAQGQVVALANPAEMEKKKSAGRSAAETLPQ